jgi:AhpD family alkylhydroperoxidase
MNQISESSNRIDPFSTAPEAMQAMLELEKKVRSLGLEPSLLHLVKTRASLLNGCGFCLHMHTRDARAAGETEERLYLLGAWRESPLYTARERAALAWTDALTLIADTNAPDDAYRELAAEFGEVERVNLTLAIVAINGWNRIAVGFRRVHPMPGGRAAA